MTKEKKFEPPFVRSAYNYDTQAVSDETGLACEDRSLTQQHQAEETDINYIVQRFGVTGYLPQVEHLPTYGDFSSEMTFMEAQEILNQGTRAFNELPAMARAYFNNDSVQFLDYMSGTPDGDVLANLGLGSYLPTQKTETAPQGDGGGSTPPSSEGDGT